MSKKLLATVEKINEHLENPETTTGLQFGTQSIRISDSQGDVASISFFVSVDPDGNLYINHNLAPAAGRQGVKAKEV